ncbi:MAG TPA: alkaline phosphatase family protein [Thermoleophilaceae bacterium]
MAVLIAATAIATVGASAGSAHKGARDSLRKIDHVVVIYEENHSFDNLYGKWEGVNGLSHADPAHTRQVKQDGSTYDCLVQNNANLNTPPQSDQCQDTNPNTGSTFHSHFFNDSRSANDGSPFRIDSYIPASAKTCPDPSTSAPANGVQDPNGRAGGCTRDLVHRYYQEQYQLNDGAQNRYTTGSDAVGLTQGYYDTRQLPIYEYLHGEDHPHYAISDDFFQGAFGGSFLNHQWLIAAHTPWFDNAATSGADDLHSIADTNAMPNNYPLYKSTNAVKDSSLTELCAGANPGQHDNPQRDAAHGDAVCGDWAVNTTQPRYQPFSPGTADSRRLPPLHNATIGDRLTAKGVSWAWYSGGWSNAGGRPGERGWTNGSGPVTRGSNTSACPDPNSNPKAVWPNCPDNLFQFHHQPFN